MEFRGSQTRYHSLHLHLHTRDFRLFNFLSLSFRDWLLHFSIQTPQLSLSQVFDCQLVILLGGLLHLIYVIARSNEILFHRRSNTRNIFHLSRCLQKRQSLFYLSCGYHLHLSLHSLVLSFDNTKLWGKVHWRLNSALLVVTCPCFRRLKIEGLWMGSGIVRGVGCIGGVIL